MIHLMTCAILGPGLPCFRGRCGFWSGNVKDFAKTGGFIKPTLAGVTCPGCLGITYQVIGESL